MTVSPDEARAALLVATRPRVYAGLADGDPLDGGAELTTPGYHRQPVEFSEPQETPGFCYVDNTAPLAFGVLPSGPSLSVTFALLADTESGATIRRAAPLDKPVEVREFEQPTIPAGALRVIVPLS